MPYNRTRKNYGGYRRTAKRKPVRRNTRSFKYATSSGAKKTFYSAYPTRRYNNPKYGKAPMKFKYDMRKYENQFSEKIIIPYKNYTIGQQTYQLNHLDAVAIPNFGPTGNTQGIVSCVVCQSGSNLNDNNQNLNQNFGGLCTAIGGYNIEQGVSAQKIVGRYARITSSKNNWNIQMDPRFDSNNDTDVPPLEDTLGNMLPHQFRFIQVKAKRNWSVAPGAEIQNAGLTPDLGTNLFIDERGESQGIASRGSVQDCFTWFLNKQKWIVLCDKRFTLGNVVAQMSTAGSPPLSGAGLSSGTEKHPPQKFFSTFAPKVNRRVRWGFSPNITVPDITEPIDMNYVIHTVVLCKTQGGSGQYPSDMNWTLQVNGTTAIVDN